MRHLNIMFIVLTVLLFICVVPATIKAAEPFAYIDTQTDIVVPDSKKKIELKAKEAA